MHYVYIIHSNTKDKYYVGESASPDLRCILHNNKHYKGAFTKIASDWKIYCTIECDSKTIALKLEKLIKKQKNRNFYQKLKLDINYRKMIVLSLNK